MGKIHIEYATEFDQLPNPPTDWEEQEKYLDIYCEDPQDWRDIKTIVLHARDIYFQTDLDHFMPRDAEGERYKYFVDLCKRLKTMHESPEIIHQDDWHRIMEAVTETDQKDIPGMSKDRQLEVVQAVHDAISRRLEAKGIKVPTVEGLKHD